MIAFIKGELVFVEKDYIILERNKTGYEIRVPLSVIEQLPNIGEEVTIHTYLYVREDALQLYGFISRDDLNIFKLLITVNGIGPKGALGILSTISPDDLRFAVLADDAKAIAKAPGIGAKTASKLILELKDKLKLEDAFEGSLNRKGNIIESSTQKTSAQKIRQEASQALVALGYSSTEALKIIQQVTITDGMDVEDVLKESLKKVVL